MTTQTENQIEKEIERIRKEEFPYYEKVRRQKERLEGYKLAKEEFKKKIEELENMNEKMYEETGIKLNINKIFEGEGK